MDDAAFPAVFVHARQVRDEVVFGFSVPAEKATEYLSRIGGYPASGESRWCAIARLNVDKGTPRPTVSQPTTAVDTVPTLDGPASGTAHPARVQNSYSRKAGILCNDIRFQRFLEERFGPRNDDDLPAWATAKLRELCGVETRADIKPSTAAADRFDRLVWAFEAEAHI